MPQRIEWVDALKVFGIMAVILGHFSTPFSGFIYSWHMPLFFFVAGFFLKITDEKACAWEAILKDSKRTILPYVGFAFLALVVEYLKRIGLGREGLDLPAEFKGIFFDMNFKGLKNHYGFVLWFLPTLFVAKSFITLVSLGFRKRIISIFPVVLVFWGLSFFLDLPFAIGSGLNATFWVFLGYLYFNYFTASREIAQGLWGLGLMAVGYLRLGKIPNMDFASLYFENIFADTSWALGFILFSAVILRGASNLFNEPVKIFINWVASSLMLFFIFHPYTNNIAHLIIEKLFGNLWGLKFLMSVSFLCLLISTVNLCMKSTLRNV